MHRNTTTTARITLKRLLAERKKSASRIAQVSIRYGQAALEVRGADWMIGLITIAIISMPLWL